MNQKIAILVLALSFVSTLARAQNLRPSDSKPEFRVFATLYSIGGAAAGFVYAQENREVLQHRGGSYPVLIDGEFSVTASARSILSGARVGDVVRIQYPVISAVELASAQEEIIADIAKWRERHLTAMSRESDLNKSIFKIKAENGALLMANRNAPLPPQAARQIEQLRVLWRENSLQLNETLKRTEQSKAQLREVQKLIFDLAKNEMPYISKAPVMISRYIAVDGDALQTVARFFTRAIEARGASMQNFGNRVEWKKVAVERTYLPNQELARSAALKMKAGFAMAGLSVVLVVEEIAAGAISNEIQDGLRGHYKPELERPSEKAQ